MAKNLAHLLQPTLAADHSAPKPGFFDLSVKSNQAKLAQLLTVNPSITVIDTYHTQLKELFILDHPALNLNPPQLTEEFSVYQQKHYQGRPPYEAGQWVYLSWRHTLLHLLDDAGFLQVRTGRNRNLITKEEQDKFYHSTIGVAGQSVGNSCALSIVQTGGGKNLKLADMDTLELTNLNRIRGSIAELTRRKVDMSARQIYELDPYANLELFADGLTEDNLDAFFDGPPRLDLVIDEIDNLTMKIRLRQAAKKRKIPVIMATDNGDSGVLDIERHDLDPNLELFHGRGGPDLVNRVVGQKLPLPEIGRIIGEELLGYDIVEERMLESLLQIGHSIPTWPQLGSAAALNGVLVAVAARKILTNQPLIEKRANVSVLSHLDPNFHDSTETARRQQSITDLGHKFSRFVAQLTGGKP